MSEVEAASAARKQSLTRAELYERVWTTPMRRLAEEFGLSDVGMAKLCVRNGIPRPPRGYWAKIEAGKKVPKVPLPTKPLSGNLVVTIQPSEKVQPELAVGQAVVLQTKVAVEAVAIPETLNRLHPIVEGWVEKHRQDMRGTRARRYAASEWYRPKSRADLTERDRYRFRVTSAFLKGVEKAGGVAESGVISGKLILKMSGEKVELTIKES